MPQGDQLNGPGIGVEKNNGVNTSTPSLEDIPNINVAC